LPSLRFAPLRPSSLLFARFRYTSRAFLTLEGICLENNDDFSIINQCFPYVAKRLLSDTDPRAQAALSSSKFHPNP
jgi:hypothetical protein